MPRADRGLVFHAEYYGDKYIVTFWPNDGCTSPDETARADHIQVNQAKNNRPYMERTVYCKGAGKPAGVADVRLGEEVNICGRKFKIIGYGDEYTKKDFEARLEAKRVAAMPKRVVPATHGYDGKPLPEGHFANRSTKLSKERRGLLGNFKPHQNADGGINILRRFHEMKESEQFRLLFYSDRPRETPGRLDDTVEGDPCIVSFPGRRVDLWNTVVASGLQYACVWTGKSCADCDRIKGKNSNPFDNICPACQQGWLKSWKDNVRTAVYLKAELQAYVFETDSKDCFPGINTGCYMELGWGHMQEAELKWLSEEMIPVTCYNEFGEKVPNPYSTGKEAIKRVDPSSRLDPHRPIQRTYDSRYPNRGW